MQINFVAPIEECSGYGEFSRHVVAGLRHLGCDVRVQPVRLDGFREVKQAMVPDGGPHKSPDISITCLVPTTFSQYRNPRARINLGFSMFEASWLPESWIEPCSKVDAILVPSSHSGSLFRKTDSKTFIARPPIDFSWADGKTRPARTYSAQNPFVFYSIFQWSERKNPAGLIRAYWAAFSGQDDVVLRLKLYLKNQDQTELARINAEIATLKRTVRLTHYPKIELITKHMTPEEIRQFHLDGDVFVSATRGEGLGLAHLEAMALGTPVISCRHSGMWDFLSNQAGLQAVPLIDKSGNQKQQPNCWLVGHSESPTYGAGEYAGFYTGRMRWYEPNLGELADRFGLARYAHGDGLLHGVQAAKDVRELYNFQNRSQDLLETLTKILGDK